MEKLFFRMEASYSSSTPSNSMRHYSLFISFLDQLIKLIVQLKGNLTSEDEKNTETPDQPTLLEFNEALRCVYWHGGHYQFTYRKAKRYEVVVFLHERAEQYVSAEEIAAKFFDIANWEWHNVRRYVKRIQEEDVGPKKMPFFIRVEPEGFTLFRLS